MVSKQRKRIWPHVLTLVGFTLLLAGVEHMFAAPAGGKTAAESADQKGEKKDNKKSADAAHHYDPMAHVQDSDEFHLFENFEPHHIHLPAPFGIQITKFMVIETIAALLILLIYVPLGVRMKDGSPPTGFFANCFEVLLTFVREEIAKPSLAADDHGHGHSDGHGEHATSTAHGHAHAAAGHDHPAHDSHGADVHPADAYVPFLWTLFLFILFNNLLGMIPFLGSPTGSIYTTVGLAIVVFFALHGSAIKKLGLAGYMHSMWPQIEVPGKPLQFVIRLMVCVIEVMGVLVKNVVLAVRLFANMFAGHVVLAVILGFILLAANTNIYLWGTITVSSVLGIVALSLLELFVAFLQAYIFTFLTALFMGMALNPQH
jgi:F-type H+-transporting ATPase subunit a